MNRPPGRLLGDLAQREDSDLQNGISSDRPSSLRRSTEGGSSKELEVEMKAMKHRSRAYMSAGHVRLCTPGFPPAKAPKGSEELDLVEIIRGVLF